MYYTYVLYFLEEKRFYIGFTSNLKRRLKEHKYNKVNSTKRKKHTPTLLFYEAFLGEEDARKRERYFKTSKGKRILRLMLQSSIALVV